jgi:aminoglycoside phosphotransferase (APT) family kinase protein
MVESTHDVSVGATTVVKRYRSWDRGEPDREWHALSLLHEHCPGLAPEPIAFTSQAGTPAITMTRVPGVPLGSAALTEPQQVAVADAMTRLHRALPGPELARLGERRSGPAELLSELRSWSKEPVTALSPVVAEAKTAGTTWLDEVAISDLKGAATESVFTLGDGNLGNFIWDGDQCRLVDFEDSGVSQVAFESADFVEHVSVWLRGLVHEDALLESLKMSGHQQERLMNCRRLFAVFWLLMLLPGARGHHRNPVGSVERQAHRLLGLLERH